MRLFKNKIKMLNKKYEDFKQNYRSKMQIENDINKQILTTFQ